ncbi:MAG: hypothetical protein QOE92_727 [Chloroflexota bacterium]|nr:hypothetical protein [Chloroflexota bacterium]
MERLSLREVLAAVAPLAVAVFAFGATFGVVALRSGTPSEMALATSALVFAGSAQFAVLAALGGGAGLAGAALTGILLNIRYLATGAAAGPRLPGNPVVRFVLSQLVIDESYAIGVRGSSDGLPEPRATLVTGLVLWLSWVAGTALGVLTGPLLGPPEQLGLDAAFPALFIALLVPLLRRPHAPRVAAAAAAVTVATAPLLPAGLPLALAALVGMLLR